MRLVSFQSVYESVVRRHGLNPLDGTVTRDTATQITEKINDRVKIGWEMWDWPELAVTEERAFRTVWNDSRQFFRVGADDNRPDELYYIPSGKYYRVKADAPSDPPIATLPTDTTYFEEMDAAEPFVSRDQSCRHTIGQVLGVYKTDPSLNTYGGIDLCLPYRPSERGIRVLSGYGATVFVWFLLPPAQFSMRIWLAGKSYTERDRVLYSVDGNCYRCISATSSALPTDADHWVMELMPDTLATYVRPGAYADCLRDTIFNGVDDATRSARMSLADGEATSAIQREIDKLIAQGQKHFYGGNAWRKASGNGLWASQPWGGDRVRLLTDVCENEWIYPTEIQVQVDRRVQIESIISGVTPITEGQDYIDVNFGTEQPNADWTLLETSVVNIVDATPVNIWRGVVTSKTTTGFRLQLNGVADSGNYELHWAIEGATGYFLSGPVSGAKGAASAQFSVSLPADSAIVGSVIVTPHDGGAGGTFTPSTLALTTAAPVATFTYTPSTYGNRTISVTNNIGLINPAGRSYVSVATAYTLTGPSTGGTGTPSTDFTVALPAGGAVAGSVIVTPDDGGDGGTFTPATVTLTTGSPSRTFTYTPATSGAKTISVTNDGGLTNPAPITYTASNVHLLNTLESYWKLDEASGNRADVHGSNTLTDVNSVGSATGKISNAAVFVSASSKALTHADNASLRVSGDFTFSFWVKLTAQPSVTYILAKAGAPADDYQFTYDPGSAGFQFSLGGAAVSSDIAIQGSLTANGVWVHLVGWYDSGDGQVYLRINDTTTVASTTSPAPSQHASLFFIGGGNTLFSDSTIDEVGFWKRKLNSEEITALNNSGNALAYGSFTV